MSEDLDKLAELNGPSEEYLKHIAILRGTIDSYYRKLINLKEKLDGNEAPYIHDIVADDVNPAIESLNWIQSAISAKQAKNKSQFNDHIHYMVTMLNVTSLLAAIGFIGLFSFLFLRVRGLQERVDEERQNRIHFSRIHEIQEMTGSLAHEINNPLAIISGSAASIKKVLSRSDLSVDKAIDKAENIMETVKRISIIIQSMKNLTHKSETKSWESFYLSDALNDVINLSSDRFKHAQIKVEVQGDDRVPLFGQANQVGQVILNLLNNSYDAVKDQRERWVKIIIVRSKDWVLVDVVDSGPKISSKISHKLMKPFFTTKAVGKGTGIGLSISKTILNDHGGNITFMRNAPHTIFRVTLPVNHAFRHYAA